MEPGSITVVAIQNPGEEAVIIRAGALTPETAIEQFGEQIQHGAFVALTDRDYHGNTTSVTLLVADRETDGRLYLQDNSYLYPDNQYKADVDDIGAVVASGDVPLPEPDLETFTVFGNNDDGEDFVAVVSATEDTVHDEGVKAGLVDEGFENSVSINLILKGDCSDLEAVAV